MSKALDKLQTVFSKLFEAEKKMKGKDPCWKGYEMIGMKKKNGKDVPNCVPKNEEVEIAEAKVGDTVSFHHEMKAAPGQKVKKSGTVEKVDGDVVHVKVKDKYGVKRHQVKMSDLVKEETELDEASDSKRPPNFTMHPIDRQDYKILKDPKKKPLPKDSKEWGRDGSEKKIKEETELDEVSQDALRNYFKKSVADLSKRQIKMNTGSADSNDAKKMQDRKKGLSRASAKIAAKMEEVEHIDELSKDTLYSYSKKSDADVEKKHKSLGQSIRKGDASGANKAAHQLNKRVSGMERAEKRLNTEDVELDEAFSDAQIARLKAEYSKISGIDPASASYKQLIALLDKQDKATLQKLADSGIKFISGLARNRVIRMKEEVELDQLFTEAMKVKKKSEETSSKKSIKKGKPLSGKQEPVKMHPEVQTKN